MYDESDTWMLDNPRQKTFNRTKDLGETKSVPTGRVLAAVFPVLPLSHIHRILRLSHTKGTEECFVLCTRKINSHRECLTTIRI